MTAPAVSADPKIESPKAESPKVESAAHPADLGKAGDATAPTPPSPADLAKVAAAKKTQIAVFISRKRQRLYIRQDVAPLFDSAVTIAQPDAPLGTHVFTALEFTGPEHTILRWNVVSLPGEPPRHVRYVEERRGRHGRVRRREIEKERASDTPPPQGPAQVFARIVEASFLSRYHPLLSSRLACLTHPIGAAIVALAGGAAASAFAIFHGAGNGILTIARGTLPLAIFGPQNYGYRLGIIGAPARMAQAAAPLAFGLLVDTMGSRVLIVSSALSLSALLALFLLRKAPSAR